MANDEQRHYATIREDSNRASVEVLITDSGVALTFLSIAETTHNPETAARNIHNARKAYDWIQDFRVRYVLTDAQTSTLDANLGKAKLRLEALGQTF